MFQQGQPAAMFYTEDIQPDHERMKAAGAEFTMPPTEVTGSTIAMVNDTCGNLVQITQPDRSDGSARRARSGLPHRAVRRSRRRSSGLDSTDARRCLQMAERKPARKVTQRSAKGTTGTAYQGFTDEERAAAKERARELKAEARRGADAAEGERDLLAKIAEMPEADRVLAERIHAIVKASAPSLLPKTWYGMPAYANRDGKVVCFFKSADKFKSRYATFGFEESANLDEGAMWPTSFALTRLTAADQKRIGALVKKAVS